MKNEYTSTAGKSQKTPLGRLENDIKMDIWKACVNISTGFHRLVIGYRSRYCEIGNELMLWSWGLIKQCSLLVVYHNLILRPPEDHRSYNNELSSSIKTENFLHQLSHKKFSTKTLNYGDLFIIEMGNKFHIVRLSLNTSTAGWKIIPNITENSQRHRC
jgi:hypothetical protein